MAEMTDREFLLNCSGWVSRNLRLSDEDVVRLDKIEGQRHQRGQALWLSTICEFALLRLDLADARAQVAALRNVCAEAYQFAGAVGAPVAVLDNLSDAAQGQALRHETFLPVLPEDCAEVAALTAERDALQVELAAAKQDTARLDWLFGEEATFLQIPNIYRMERRLMVPWADASTAGQESLAQGVGPTPPQAKTEEA